MRIAQIAPLAERIPPSKYGGTERVICTLTDELVRRGHDVTLFASGDSFTTAKLVSVIPKSLREMKYHDMYGFNLPNLLNTGLAYSLQDQFDVIHDHNPHQSLPTANIARTPVVMTWHGPYDREMIEYCSVLNRPHLVSISKSQAARAPELKFAGTVYNGLNLKLQPFSDSPEDYLLFIGRIDAEKGTHIAIEVAVRLKKRLIIAAKLDDMVPHIKQYFEREIKPRLRKHADLVTLVGEVNERQRNELMKKALCVLHPVTWPEPFGLTLIEAMGCGCPVVAFSQGSIPEVIQNKKSGFVVKSFDEMLDAVSKVATIDRHYCRSYALENFSAQRMADGYEKIYQKAIKGKVKATDARVIKQFQIEP